MTSRRSSSAIVALLSVVALAGYLRAVHADFGLPNRYHPDEALATVETVKIAHGARTLTRYRHPPLLKLLAAGVLAAGERLDAGGRLARQPTLALRSVSVAAGTLAVLLLYGLTRRMVPHPWPACAALVYAVFPIAVVQSKYGAPDALMAALFLAGVWSQVLLYEKPSAFRYFACGLVLMLAVAAKYNAALVSTSLLTAHFLAEAKHDPSTGRYPVEKMAAACTAGGLLGFLAGFPFVPFGDLGTLVGSLLYEREHLFAAGHAGISVAGLDYAYAYYFLKTILPAGGPLLLAAIVAGLVHLAARRRPVDLILIAAIVPYYVVIEHAYKVEPSPERYVLPLVALYVLAAITLAARVVDAVTRERHQGFRFAVVCAVTVMLAAWPAARTLRVLGAMEPDTRAIMREWIEANVPAGARILSHRRDLGFYYPFLSPRRYQLIPTAEIERSREPVDYVLASSLVYQRYLDHPNEAPEMTDFYRRLRSPERLVHAVARPDGRYMFHNPTLELYRPSDSERDDRDDATER